MSEFQQGIAPSITTPRASFNLSNRHATTIDFDNIYPVWTEEVLPGSTYNVSANIFGRFLTLLNPIMDNTYLDIHFWFAPNRILFDNFRKFMGEQTDPGDSIDYTIPIIQATASTGYAELSIHDYFGLPTKTPDYQHIALYHRLYNQVWNEFYRDQNLQDSIAKNTGDGPDLATDYTIQKRNKRHDYFTSGLPNLIKDPASAQTLPLGATAPVIASGNAIKLRGTTEQLDRDFSVDGTNDNLYMSSFGGGTQTVKFGTETGLEVDLTNATAATILQLRQAVQIQAILELDARAGTRYPEQLYAVYGVQYVGESYRPEYLG